MLARRRRRWTSLYPTAAQCIICIMSYCKQYMPTITATKPHFSKHLTLIQCWRKAGLAAKTMGQHWSNIGSMSDVCRAPSARPLEKYIISKACFFKNQCIFSSGFTVLVIHTIVVTIYIYSVIQLPAHTLLAMVVRFK